MKYKPKAPMPATSSVLFVSSVKAQADTISIVSDTAYVPFEFEGSGQTYRGINVDIIKEVAEREGWDYEQTYPDFDAAVNVAQFGQVDALMAGTIVTDARKKAFTFSDTYCDTPIVVYTRSGNTIISRYSQLGDKTVGVKNGIATQTWLDEHADKYGYTVKTFDISDLISNSLDSGSIDAVMSDTSVVQYAISQGKSYEISIDVESIGSFALVVKKGSGYEYLIDEFSEALAAMKKDGTYDQIMQRWLDDSYTPSSSSTSSSSDSPNSAVSSILTSTGDASAKATSVKSTYKIVMDSSLVPSEYQNDSGEYEGINAESIEAIVEQQGFSVEISNPGFDAAFNAVQAERADVVMTGTSITDVCKEIFDFSDAYYTSNILLAVKSGSSAESYSDLKGLTVGAKNGAPSYTWLSEHADEYGYTLKAFDEASTMYDSLNSGSIDALMNDEAILPYATQQGRDSETPIAGEESGEYGSAASKGSNPELIEMPNNGLAVLVESGEYDEIVNKYLGTSDSLSSSSSSSSVDETTVWGPLKNDYLQLSSGLDKTFSLAPISSAIAMVTDVTFGMMAIAPNKVLRTISVIFVDIVRGIPLMIVAAFTFRGIPNLLESITGKQNPINDFIVATITLSLNDGVYIAEIVRGGIEVVPQGQMEASRSLGTSYSKAVQKIILPQAVRLMLPNFINQFVISLKDTIIVSAAGPVELSQTGRIIIACNYQSLRVYAILAVIYLVIVTLLIRLAKRLEKRLK